jgi:hypothetical protein
MLGSLPWATHGRIKSKLAPSHPTSKMGFIAYGALSTSFIGEEVVAGGTT